MAGEWSVLAAGQVSTCSSPTPSAHGGVLRLYLLPIISLTITLVSKLTIPSWLAQVLNKPQTSRAGTTGLCSLKQSSRLLFFVRLRPSGERTLADMLLNTQAVHHQADLRGHLSLPWTSTDIPMSGTGGAPKLKQIQNAHFTAAEVSLVIAWPNRGSDHNSHTWQVTLRARTCQKPFPRGESELGKGPAL